MGFFNDFYNLVYILNKKKIEEQLKFRVKHNNTYYIVRTYYIIDLILKISYKAFQSKDKCMMNSLYKHVM